MKKLYRYILGYLIGFFIFIFLIPFLLYKLDSVTITLIGVRIINNYNLQIIRTSTSNIPGVPQELALM